MILSVLLAGIPGISHARNDMHKTYYAETSFLKEVDYYRSYQLMLNAGIFYTRNPLLSVGPELSIYQYIEKGYASTGVGLRPVIKVNLLRYAKFSLFTEVKGGIVYMMPSFHYGGSRLNFTLNGSVGADIHLTANTSMMLAVRYAHLSNFDFYGAFNNPSWDGLGLAIGIIKKLP
jgi:hypothetical protein